MSNETDQNDYRDVFRRMIKLLKGDKSEEEEIRKKEAAQKAAREAVRTAVKVTVLTAVAAVATTAMVERISEATPTVIKTAAFVAAATLTAPLRAATTAENHQISSSEEADESEGTPTTAWKDTQIDDGEDANDGEDISMVWEGHEPEGEDSIEQEETTTAREEVEDDDSSGQVDDSWEEALQSTPERVTPTDLDILMDRAAELRGEVALTVHATPEAEGASAVTIPATPTIVTARAVRAPRATAAERRRQRRAERAEWRREYEEYKPDKENWIECHNGGVPFEDPNRNLPRNPFFQPDGTIEGALRAAEYRRTLEAERAQALMRHNDEMRRRALECYRQLRLDYDRMLLRGERVGKRRPGAREHKWQMTVFAASMTPEQLEKEFEIELALAERKAQRSGKAADLAELKREFAEMCAMVEDCKAQVRAKRDRMTWMLR
ncbi:hypothetical protein BN946_scf184591.g2 [Trametes cinnabarina]|uniref:Uncharacterized protein n=1 Tax=Pycnoporus cinnabarinus TaxID=5643 RepID=A0A060SQS3_PYCCI|nr:hypothetical protein BN946_scf184591.g2 [Trametes cinnabarina]